MLYCKHGTRQTGAKGIKCALLADKKPPYNLCGNQYFCRKAGRWEQTENAQKCPVNK